MAIWQKTIHNFENLLKNEHDKNIVKYFQFTVGIKGGEDTSYAEIYVLKMKSKSHKLAVLTSNLKLSYSQNFEYYLREVWVDLINRQIKNAKDTIKIKV